MKLLAGIASAVTLLAGSCAAQRAELDSSPFCLQAAFLVDADSSLGDASSGMVLDAAGVEWRYAAGLLRVRGFADLTLSSEDRQRMTSASLVLERIDTSVLAYGTYDEAVELAAADIIAVTEAQCETVRFGAGGFICAELATCP